VRYEKTLGLKVDGSRERRLQKGSHRLRRAWAVMFAACAHVMALLALGWRIPRPPPPPPPPVILPPIVIELLRPPTAMSAAPIASAAGHTRPSPVRPSQPDRPAPPAEVAAPRASGLAEGPPDCEPEDLPLLTEAERQRCRNQIDADKGRRLARAAEERAAQRLAEKISPLSLNIAADKKAAYDHYVYCAKLHKGPIPPPSENRGLGAAAGQCWMGTW
jgi:hypothetical protein